MPGAKADILSQLQQQIFPLQGLKHVPVCSAMEMGLGPIESAFPNAVFPTGAVHEFISDEPSGAAATAGFIAALLGSLMGNTGATVWISSGRLIFPPALKAFGLTPERIIFIDVSNEKHILWALEEALKCNGLAAVVGELPEISFTSSRRLQLAVEQSRVTGFIVRHQPRNLGTIACISRWKITSITSVLPNGLPGVGFPTWKVELLKIRNGKPGTWDLEYRDGKFNPISVDTILPALKRKTG